MRTREQKQEQFKEWLLDHPGHLKTNFNTLAVRFDLSYNEVKEIVSEVRAELFGAERRKDLYRVANEVKEVTKKYYENIFTIKPFIGGDVNNVLIIGDTHIPFERDGYMEHCRKVQEQFNCGTVVHIGDVIDNNYSSYHETNPDGISAGDELELAVARLQKWYYTFPNVKVCLGNHDQIIQRKAYSSGLSKRWIKGLAEVLQVPDWDFNLEHQIKGVIYSHGTGTSGDKAAFTRALNRRRSIVSGHLHTTAGITWNVSDVDRIFAMQVGCGIDDTKYSFDYAKTFSKKSIVSCGVVLDGKLPIIIPMEL